MLKHALGGALLLAASSSLCAAEPVEYQSWVGGFVEIYYPDSDKPNPIGFLDDGDGFGGEFGFRFEDNWAARIEWSNLDLETQNVNLEGIDGTGDRIGVDALYFLKEDWAYLFAGVKHANYGNKHRMANLGIGKHWQITDNWRVISEAAVYHDFGESFRDVGFKLGIAYTFGGQASSKLPRDSDRDGVYDNQDQCPNTPAGTRVDATGCNWDKDGDGVANSVDQCPNTPPGTAVDARGCNNDLDGDGVVNALDKCPNTPPGTKVGAKGCSLALDSDQDGVLDADDKCPNTPLSDKVDAQGCSIFEEKEVSVSLQVLFDNNSADVNNPDSEQFVEFADFLKRFPNTQATIEGHTSKVGTAEYNQQLSDRRAKAVRQLLIEQYGISAERLEAVGYGETRLLDDGDSSEAHRINRRIEALVTAMEKVKVQR